MAQDSIYEHSLHFALDIYHQLGELGLNESEAMRKAVERSGVEEADLRSLMEDADYDHGKERPVTRGTTISAYDFVSGNPTEIKDTGSYGDNAMGPSIFEDQGVRDQLTRIFLDAGISQDRIAKGLKVKPAGIQKLAGQLGISPDETKTLIDSLAEKNLSEDDDFAYERDYLGNVIVRNGDASQEKTVSVVQGNKLLKTLGTGDDDQKQNALKSVMEDIDFETEIEGFSGSYNFPWSYEGQTGTASMLYRTDQPKLSIRLQQVRDADGDVIAVDGPMKEALTKQAVDFLGKE